MSFFLLFTYALIGLLSGAHCSGRCSGMIGAINSSLRPYSGRRPLWLAMTAGRLTGYIVAGGLAGGVGALLLHYAPAPLRLNIVFPLVGGVMLILMGISIAGRPAAIAWSERPGHLLWAWLQPLWRAQLPPHTGARAYLAGLLWGWLPCGLVYTMCINALASASIGHGAVVMAAFGLGTVPNILAISWLSGGWRHHFQDHRVRLLSGLLIILASVQQTVRLVAVPLHL